MYCSQCGKHNEESSKFCGYCGAPIVRFDVPTDIGDPDYMPMESVTPSGTKKRAKAIVLISSLIGCGIALILILALIIIPGMGRHNMSQSGKKHDVLTEESEEIEEKHTVRESVASDTSEETVEIAGQPEVEGVAVEKPASKIQPEAMEASPEGLVDASAEDPVIAEPEITVLGQQEYNGMIVTASIKDAKTVVLSINNDTSGRFSFGWVDGSVVTATTEVGDYYYTMPVVKVFAGESGDLELYFDNLEGTVSSIKIDNVYTLQNTGIPVFSSVGDSIVINAEGSIISSVVQGYIEGYGEANGMSFTISQEASNSICVHFENNSESYIKFGWVNTPTAKLSTDIADYYCTINVDMGMQVAPGSEGDLNLYFDGVEGTLQQLTIDSINVIGSTGLPTTFDGGSSCVIPLTYS